MIEQCRCWRKHSKDYPRGATPPMTIESLQAAWDRDQEVLFEQRQEISKLQQRINTLEQKIMRGR